MSLGEELAGCVRLEPVRLHGVSRESTVYVAYLSRFAPTDGGEPHRENRGTLSGPAVRNWTPSVARSVVVDDVDPAVVDRRGVESDLFEELAVLAFALLCVFLLV